MEVVLENIISYGLIILIIGIVLYFYFKKINKTSREAKEKIKKAKDFGFYEPVSLHPVIDLNKCIGSGACIAACPEQDILGWVNGHGETINASRCVGHGACFHACPVEAITLVMGTEKRGVELPHVSPDYETNVPGIYIAGELGGMGLIKNAVRQGSAAIENIAKKFNGSHKGEYDVAIIGAGPAGIAATLKAAERKLKFITLEQDTLGGTVFSFPRAKIVMTSPMDLPLYGRVKLVETSKTELLGLWQNILEKNKIRIYENHKVTGIERNNGYFQVETNKGNFTAAKIVLAIGKRGSPRKLGVPGENKEKVAYRLLEPELIKNQNVLVVGGGDSAVESAMLIANEGNNVLLSYRGNSFKRIKPKNLEKISDYEKLNKLRIIYNSNVLEIKDKTVIIEIGGNKTEEIDNDLIYIFAGGELPSKFLNKFGITITKKFGESVLKHD